MSASPMGSREWDLAEQLERCASVPKVAGSNPSGGSELTRDGNWPRISVEMKIKSA
jgi:hypothetical protein